MVTRELENHAVGEQIVLDLLLHDAGLGGAATQVTAKNNTSSTINILPGFSPDGRSITFSGMPNGQPVRHIYRIGADGSGKAQNLTGDFPDSFAGPQWRR